MVTPDFTHDGPGTHPSAWRGHPAWTAAPTVEVARATDLTRVVVLAAHPDDESLGAAGLLATAADAGIEVDLVLATAGEGSHPCSPTHPPGLLAKKRLAESRAALKHVAPEGRTTFLSLPDGGVAEEEDHLVEMLVRLVGDGRSTLLLSAWRHDGHPDHEACGRAAAVVARRTGARLLQFPIWFWHWGAPEKMPWSRVRVLPLSGAASAAKHAAIEAHATQVRRLSAEPGDERLLQADFLAHFDGPVETFFEEDSDDDALDELHRRESDPWATETSWYERRKRQLTLAALPRTSYQRGLELGCSVGVLAADLVERCRSLLAIDASRAAVAATSARIGSTPGVRVECRELPEEWPAGSFDLIVLSEVGYFLSPAGFDDLVGRIDASLEPDGDLVLCHWRHPVDGWPLDGPSVHDRVRMLLPRPEVATYRDRDVEICVFSRTALPAART